MAIKFTVNGYTFEFEEGEIDTVECTINANLENVPISSTGPLGGYVYDYEGVGKFIVIKGKLFDTNTTRVVGYTITTIQLQKEWLESLCYGNQSNITFQSNYERNSVVSGASATAPNLASFNSTTCKVASLKFIEREATPDLLEFEITLIVGQ